VGRRDKPVSPERRRREIGDALERLRREDEAERSWAARRLGRLHASEAVEALGAALAEDTEAVRLAAAKALTQICSAAAAPALERALGDRAPAVRREAARGLARLPDTTAALAGALADPSAEVRRVAAEAMGRARDRAASAGLQRLLRDRDPGVRQAAAGALQALGQGDVLVERALEDPGEVGLAAALSLADAGDPRAAAPLLALLEHRAPEVRAAAAGALGRLGAETPVDGALEGLLLRLLDEAAGVRAAAVDALVALGRPGWRRALDAGGQARGEVEDQDAIRQIRDALDRPGLPPAQRRRWVALLGRLRDRGAAPKLIPLLGERDPALRLEAARALDALGQPRWGSWIKGQREDFARLSRAADPQAAPALLRALAPQEEDLSGEGRRILAAEGLAALRAREAAAPLAQAMADGPTRLRCAAAAALGALGERAAVPALWAASGEPEVGPYALVALARLGESGALERCLDQLRGWGPGRAALIPALLDHPDRRVDQALRAAVGDLDPAVRRQAAAGLTRRQEPGWRDYLEGERVDLELLGRSGLAVAVLPLLRALEAAGSGLEGGLAHAIRAASALGHLQDPRGVAALSEALSADAPRLRAAAALSLGQLGHPQAIPALLTLLKAGTPNSRAAASWALARLDHAEARAGLREALGDRSPAVRASAAQALADAGDPRWRRLVLGEPEDWARLAGEGGPDALPALACGLDQIAVDPSAGLQREALIGALVARGTPEIVGALEALGSARGLAALLAAPEAQALVLEALEALGRLGGPEAVAALEGFLQGPARARADTLSEELETFFRLDRRALQRELEALRGPRLAALGALARLSPGSEAINEALADRDPELRRFAAPIAPRHRSQWGQVIRGDSGDWRRLAESAIPDRLRLLAMASEAGEDLPRAARDLLQSARAGAISLAKPAAEQGGLSLAGGEAGALSLGDEED
jgi:HEAT repeat protein